MYGTPEDQTVKSLYTQMYKLFLTYKSYYLTFFPISDKPGFTMGTLSHVFINDETQIYVLYVLHVL